MADFDRTASLSIVVPDRELRDARDELEDALADVPVGVSASGGGAGGATGTNSAREQRRRRREFRWARQRTDDVERQVELLENIEGELTEGSLGGGGGGLFGDLLGVGGEGAGIATDLGPSVVDLLAPALGSLVGTAVGQQVGGGGGGGAGGGDLQIQEPLGVTVENTPLDVTDDRPAPSVEVDLPALNPRFEPVFQPSFRPTFNPELTTEVSPEFDLPDVSVGGGGSGLSEPVDVIVTNTPLSVSGRRATGGRPAPTGGQGGGPERFAPFEKLPLIGDRVEQINDFAAETIDRVPIIGGLGNEPGSGNSSGTQRGGGAPAGVSASTGDVSVTVNANVQGAVQQALEQIRREQERQRQELRRDLEGQINDLRRQIQSGGRSGLGGSIQ